MVDYSRFDHIDTDDEEEEPKRTVNVDANRLNNTSIIKNQGLIESKVVSKKTADGRIRFEYEGRVIYEWDQGLDEVNIYITPPPQITRRQLVILITSNHLKVGVKDSPYFLDEDLGGLVIEDESTWTLNDGEIQIILQKMRKGEVWDCALLGSSGSKVDEFTKEEMKKKILLERFQEEHPGFDFSGAEFNGSVPNARDFMGGVKYK